MKHQCSITNGSGEVTKKRKLLRFDENVLPQKMITTAEGFAYPLINKGDNKIYYDDDDPSYPKNITVVEQVDNNHLVLKQGYMPSCESLNNMMIKSPNDKCLAKMFTYVPICERPKLALVCKEWKRALDNAWYDVKKLELIYWQYDENPSFLYKNYLTIDGQFNFLKTLLNKCGRYLTKLDLTAYGNCKIVPVINRLCPNLETLRLRFTNMDRVMLANSFTTLFKLKSLTIIFQNIKSFPLSPTVALIYSLRNVAKTLSNLSLLNWVDELQGIPSFTSAIINVLPDLKALKTLEFAGVQIPHDLFDYLINNEIFHFNHTVHLKYIPILKPFEDIKLLRFNGRCRIRDDTLYSIANTFKNLKLLHMHSTWVTDDGVVALSKMNNLRYLNFEGCNDVTDSSIKLLKNLIQLGLPSSNKITDESIITVLENSPKMSVLDVNGTNVTVELVKKAAEISKIRKQRLIFCVASMPDIQRYDSPYFDLRIYQEVNGKPTAVSVSASAHADSGLTTS